MKNLKNLAVTIATLFCCIAANAQTFEVDGLEYFVTSTTDLTVLVQKGSTEPTGDVVIPATVTYNDKVYVVTSIGGEAFRNCSSLTSITIPEGVTSIGNSAFSGCSSLTSITIPESLESIGYYAFGSTWICNIHITSVESWLSIDYGNATSHPNYSQYGGINVNLYIDGKPLKNVVIPSSITSIPSYAFMNCKGFSSIEIPESVTSIGEFAFRFCDRFDEIHIANLESWLTINFGGGAYFEGNLYMDGEELTEVVIPSSITAIRDLAFFGCKNLTSVFIPESITSIGSDAFAYCSNLISITLPESVVSIGGGAFNGGVREVILKSSTPPMRPTYASSLVPTNVVLAVPADSYDTYVSDSYWSDVASQITIDDVAARIKDISLIAVEDKSALHMAIGEENLKYVTHLTLSGTINSYDFMIMRNKMPLLRHIDLTDVSIVHNAYEHYTGYHTEDNELPAYAFYGCNILTVALPKSLVKVGEFALAESTGYSDNNNLEEVKMYEGVVSIEKCAFNECGLSSIALPKGLISIGDGVFGGCNYLKTITLPEGLVSIGNSSFEYCSALENVIFPSSVENIGYRAFGGCSNLKEIRLPSSIRVIGDYAFYECSMLSDIYSYSVEPISIEQNSFPIKGTSFVASLHAPKVSYWDYYYDTQWSQFASFAEFDEPYENFYLNGDKTLDDNTGDIRGEEDDAPDAEMGNNSGLIVEDNVNQELGDVDIEHNGTDGGSIIVGGDGCVNADKLHFHINVTGGKWYFFCFPFDVKREDIKMENGADWVFRYYDGEERANNGKGGWKNVTSDGNGNHLKAATGYIFQCSKDDVLILTAKNHKIKQEKKYNELVEHVTQNAHDASWNFVGNPYLSYYEVTSDDYSAPITVWDGSKYIAIRPGDDDYQLAPFEAFFVQKPEGTANIEYNPEQQMTYHQSVKASAKARARRRTMPVDPARLLVNITLSNGTDTDQTRVVFNNEAALGYEAMCDAAKFSTAGMPQLYTVDSRAVKYAINERPAEEGIVTMGYTAPAEGNYTLAAPRMDTPIVVKDNLTGTIHDFSEGDYTFMTQAGTYEDRFTVMTKAGTTGIDRLESTDNSQQPIYDAAGRRVEKMEQGIYIKENRKVVRL